MTPTRPIAAAATILLMLAAACAGVNIAEFDALMKRGEAEYAAAQYRQAFDTFNAAAKIVDRKDDARFIQASERSGDAFCMQNFSDARRDLEAGDQLLASMGLSTVLGVPECAKFTEQIEWARRQMQTIPKRAP